MLRLSSVLCVTSALVLGACQNQSKAPVIEEGDEPEVAVSLAPTEVRTCDSGAVIEVDYLGTDQMRLTHKDKVFILNRMPTGQGLHYSGEGAEWTVVTRQGEEQGRLSLVGADKNPVVAEECRRPAPQLAAAPRDSALKPCISPDLKYGIESGDAGMGHRLATIRVENAGRSACQLDGYPRVALLNADDQPIGQIRAEARTEGYFGRVRVGVPVLLQAGQKAYFDLGWGVIPYEAEGEKTCPEAKRLRLSPPGDNGGGTIDLSITPCGGKVEVSPYRAGRDGQAATPPAP